MANDFNIGKQCSAVIIGPFGRLDLALITEFMAKQVVDKVKVKPLNGPPIEKHLPGGWEGGFKLDRANSAADDFIALVESGYWAGTSNVPVCTLFQYVTELNGSLSTYQFDGVALHLSDAGSYKANEAVKQSVDFFASTRKRV